MPFVPAKCTQCGANIEVDSSQEAGICKYCGTAFITEKAINNYNINVTNNFDGANINVVGGDIDNLLSLAQAAFDASNYEEAYSYANRALEINTKSAQAWVLKMGALGQTVKIGDPKVNELVSYGTKAVEVANDDEKADIERKVYLYWLEMACAFMTTAASEIADVELIARVAIGANINEKAQIAKDDLEQRNLMDSLAANAINLATAVPVTYSNEEVTEKFMNLANLYLQYCENDVKRIELYDSYLVDRSVQSRKNNLEIIKDRIPNEKKEELSGPELRAGNSSSGCYIATSVYGSYDCPEVWTLRRFRDNYLDNYILGRKFIKCYYAVSPTLVEKYGHTKWFKSSWKTVLNAFVRKLKNAGYKDTPYQDKY